MQKIEKTILPLFLLVVAITVMMATALWLGATWLTTAALGGPVTNASLWMYVTALIFIIIFMAFKLWLRWTNKKPNPKKVDLNKWQTLIMELSIWLIALSVIFSTIGMIAGGAFGEVPMQNILINRMTLTKDQARIALILFLVLIILPVVFNTIWTYVKEKTFINKGYKSYLNTMLFLGIVSIIFFELWETIAKAYGSLDKEWLTKNLREEVRGMLPEALKGYANLLPDVTIHQFLKQSDVYFDQAINWSISDDPLNTGRHAMLAAAKAVFSGVHTTLVDKGTPLPYYEHSVGLFYTLVSLIVIGLIGGITFELSKNPKFIKKVESSYTWKRVKYTILNPYYEKYKIKEKIKK